MFGLGVQSKVYFSVVTVESILLIADEGCELELLIQEHSIGWFCESGDIQKLANIIDEVCETCLTVGSKIHPRELLIKNFSEKSLLQFKHLADNLFKQ